VAPSATTAEAPMSGTEATSAAVDRLIRIPPSLRDNRSGATGHERRANNSSRRIDKERSTGH
jgi:hypothetical protein